MAGKNISMAVIRRLPKYYRYLGDLLDNDVQRISSKELSEIIGFTASQIRQDLNNFGGFGQQGYGYQNQYQNPVDDFVKTYEQHCDTLWVGYNADKYEIKLNYRKLAKKYHPDINKAADATAKFQEVNNAYDFLSNEQNIERYNRIKNKK